MLACEQYKRIGDQVRQNLVQNAMDRLNEAVADFTFAIENDDFGNQDDHPIDWEDEARLNGQSASVDTVELLSAMYP